MRVLPLLRRTRFKSARRVLEVTLAPASLQTRAARSSGHPRPRSCTMVAEGVQKATAPAGALSKRQGEAQAAQEENTEEMAGIGQG